MRFSRQANVANLPTTSTLITFIARFASRPGGYTLVLAIVVLVLLLTVGFGVDTLPFPPQSMYSDAAVSHWPAALYLQQSLRTGHFPLWRDLLMSGQPFAANPLNKVWYPPQWLVVLFPVTLFLNLMTWAHLVLAGVGMRALGIRLGIKAAGVMGVAYALTPRLIAAVGAGHLDVVYAAAWFPWVLWAVHYAILQTGHVGRRVAVLSLICAMCFLADVRLSAFVFATGAAFGLWLLWPKWRSGQIQKRVTIVVLLVSAALVVGLTAVEWLPLAALAPSLTRGDLTPADSAVYSLQPAQLLGLLLPDRGGFHETMTYFGVTVLILAMIGLALAPRQRLFWAFVVGVAALYALGDHGPLWPLLVRIAPPLLWLRVPSRAWIVAVVGAIILAGYGVDALTEHSLPRRLLPLAAVGLLGAGASCGIVMILASLPLRPGAGIALVGGLLATGGLLLASRRLRVDRVILVTAMLIAVDLAWTDVSLARGVPQSQWLDAYASLANALRAAGVTRLYSPDYSLPQQVAAYWQIPQFGGVDPFQLRDYVPAFEAATGTSVNGYSVTLPPFDTDDVASANKGAKIDAAALGRWNVSHVLAAYPIDNPDLKLVSRPDDLYLYENERKPSDVNVKWDDPNRFTAINGGSQAINVESFAPGWSVQGNNGGAIDVAPGETITSIYSAPGLTLAILLSALSLVAVSIAGLRRR